MLRFKEKRIIPLFILLLTSIFLIPFFRIYIIDLCEYSLKITHFFYNTFKAIIFSHYNFLDNIRLREELELLKKNILDYQELIKENKRLKALLSFKEDSPFNLVSARVIMRSEDSWLSFIIIDKGRNDGLRENLPVICPSGLVGRIVELGNFTAKVLLLTDPSFCVSAMIQESRKQGLVCGTLENYLVMRYLDEVEDIKIKDIVITAGLTELFPKGILVGEVIDIKKDPIDGRAYLKIKPKVDFYTLEEVMVILK